MIYDLAIIGGGPAGTAGAVYAARKQLKTVLVAKEFGGQSVVSEDIQNWIGTPHISGSDLAKSLENHVKEYAGEYIDIRSGEYVVSITKNGDNFIVKTDKEDHEAKAVLVTVGSVRRKLEVPGADTFEHKGLTYCASCDGPLFSGQDVAVIGGGNAAFESAAQLLAYCKSVTMINRSDKFRADEVTVEKVKSHPNMKIVTDAEMTEIYGDAFVKGLKYKDKNSGEIIDLPLAGIFIEIGLIPSTDLVGDLVEKNEYGQIKVDPRTQQTNTKGVWAAGDCTDGLYHQNNIAAGDAVRALEDIYVHLKTK